MTTWRVLNLALTVAGVAACATHPLAPVLEGAREATAKGDHGAALSAYLLAYDHGGRSDPEVLRGRRASAVAWLAEVAAKAAAQARSGGRGVVEGVARLEGARAQLDERGLQRQLTDELAKADDDVATGLTEGLAASSDATLSAVLRAVDRMAPRVDKGHPMKSAVRDAERRAIAFHRGRVAAGGGSASRRYLHVLLAYRWGGPKPQEQEKIDFAREAYIAPALRFSGASCPALERSGVARAAVGRAYPLDIEVNVASCVLEAEAKIRYDSETRESSTVVPGSTSTNCWDESETLRVGGGMRTETRKVCQQTRTADRVDVRRHTESTRVPYVEGTLNVAGTLTARGAPPASFSVKKVAEGSTPDNAKQQAASDGGLSFDETVRAEVKRATEERARAEDARGRREREAGNEEAAEDAFVNVLVLASAEPGPDATSWFKERYALDAGDLSAVLAGRHPPEAVASLHLPPPYRFPARESRPASKGKRAQFLFEGFMLTPEGGRPAEQGGLIHFVMPSMMGYRGAVRPGWIPHVSAGYFSGKHWLFDLGAEVGPSLNVGRVFLVAGLGAGMSAIGGRADEGFKQPGAIYLSANAFGRLSLTKSNALEASFFRSADAGFGESLKQIGGFSENEARETRVQAGIAHQLQSGVMVFVGGRLVQYPDARSLGLVIGFGG